jgi:superfamily II DNA or RNA helicase
MTSPDSPWLLAEPAAGVQVLAEHDGVWLCGPGVTGEPSHRMLRRTQLTRLGRLLPTVIPQLCELGLATAADNGVRITYTDFTNLETHDIDAFADLAPWAPFTLELAAHRWLGATDFCYRYRLYLGTQPVVIERRGCFVRRAPAIYRLDPQTFALIEAIDAFNALPAEDKASPDAFLRFATVKGLAEGIGAQLDRYMAQERVLVPSRLGLDLIIEDEGRISFAPKIDGVEPEAMRRAFFALDDVEIVYALDAPDGGRVRVVLDGQQREVLRRMERVRHLSGAERAVVLRAPQAVFDGVAEAVDIDPVAFGPRVQGIGDFPFVTQPYLRQSSGIFDDPAGLAVPYADGTFSAGLTCRYADGSSEDVPFTSRQELLALHQAARDAWHSGSGTIDFRGKSILVDASFIQAFDELVAQALPPASRQQMSAPKGRYLLIYRNEEALEYTEDTETADTETALTLPQALKSDVVLKAHQRAGVAWLQRNLRLSRRGCLMADDMGLGKTLQVLTFLAWLIEQGTLSPDSTNPEAAPWDPILIVMPVILLQNETWLEDMRKFFQGDGAIFMPWLALHGAALQKMRRSQALGKETAIGDTVLDLERLRQYRVILTNYETITNYQHSFARMTTHWSIVVTDEAQEYKTPSTKISHALKSLYPRLLRIACTGTPVETRLLDVWNLFDFLQPGYLLDSAAEFSKQYETPRNLDDATGAGTALVQLKERLHFGRSDAFLIRRDKTSLRDLPAKHEQPLHCYLSPEQRRSHLEILGRAHTGGEENHSLSLLHHLMRLTQHPALVPRYEPLEAAEALAQCPKLKTVLDSLRAIKAKHEKALIFTRILDMQQLLATVINAEFGLHVDIINGATSRRGDTQSGSQTRRAIVQRFRASPGFNVLVLSPDVAGIGLTLIEANHVIHYGRWWNPAKESQATDRVYRIGQTRDVHVYYPIATDPVGEFTTFDEKLDALIQRRRQLAQDFLTPMAGEDTLERELFTDVCGTFEGATTPTPSQPLSPEDVRHLPPEHFEALVAALEAQHGAHVLLTPYAADGGIDVIAIQSRVIRLVQCKHTLWDTHVEADVIAEVVAAFDGYRARWLAPLVSTHSLRPVIVTNGEFTRQAQKAAAERGIELIAARQLWRLLVTSPCTLTDVLALAGRRLVSMHELPGALRLIWGVSNS